MNDFTKEGLKLSLEKKLPREKAWQKVMPERIQLIQDIPTNPKESAVLILLFEEQDSWEVAYIQRNTYKGVHSGQIAFPGGKVELTDKNFEETALRESEEEIGIDRNRVEMLGELSSIYVPPSNFRIHPFVGIYKGIPDFVRQESEVENIFKISLNEIIDSNNWQQSEVTASYSNKKIKVNGFSSKSGFVWGATAMITKEFQEVLMNSFS